MFTATVYWQRPLFFMPVLALGVGFVSLQGCAEKVDAVPIHASDFARSRPTQSITVSLRAEHSAPMPAEATVRLRIDRSRPSLKRASDLLRQAADALGTNERQAVQMIRQALGILKREGISGLDALDYDRVSAPSGL
jgi:hypothetical protein